MHKRRLKKQRLPEKSLNALLWLSVRLLRLKRILSALLDKQDLNEYRLSI